MDRETRIMEVQELEKKVKRSIPIGKFIRHRIVREEIVEAYKSPVPAAVVVDKKQKMVEVGDWIVIHPDGSQDTFKPDEFPKTFEAYVESKETFDSRRK